MLGKIILHSNMNANAFCIFKCFRFCFVFFGGQILSTHIHTHIKTLENGKVGKHRNKTTGNHLSFVSVEEGLIP